MVRLALLSLAVLVSGCSHRRSPSRDDAPVERSAREATPPGSTSVEAHALPPEPPIPKERPLVYLVSKDDFLYSFDPDRPGMAAYGRVGHIGCSSSSVDSMAVDQKSIAWVFYGDGTLVRVDVRDASCQVTSGIQADPLPRRLGMGFTSNTAGSSEETLYVISARSGLATVAFPSLVLSRVGDLDDGELTGGNDGRLFLYAPSGTLSEVDRHTLQLRTVHPFRTTLAHGGYAFARYAGIFYVFTSHRGGTSRASSYDPKTNVEKVRDEDLGFQVVGAGQSTRVPTVERGAISGSFPEDAR